MAEKRTQALVAQGDELLAAGELSAALDAYDAALDHDPADVAALTHAGSGLMAAGLLAEAEAYLAEAASIAPEDPGVWWLLGTTALASGHGDQALAAFRRSRELGADDAQLLLDLTVGAYFALDAGAARAYAGEAARSGETREEASAWIAKLEHLDDEGDLLVDVARAHCRQGRMEVGIRLLEVALAHGITYERLLYLGRAYLALGDAANAEPLLEAAADSRPDDDAARHSLADARALSAALTPEAARPAAAPQRFCVRCGAALPPGTAFCVRCGMPVMGGDR